VVGVVHVVDYGFIRADRTGCGVMDPGEDFFDSRCIERFTIGGQSNAVTQLFLRHQPSITKSSQDIHQSLTFVFSATVFLSFLNTNTRSTRIIQRKPNYPFILLHHKYLPNGIKNNPLWLK
jgi:hypothetical protein